MKKIFIWLLILLAIGVGLYYWNTEEVPVPQVAVYNDSSLPLSFEYRDGQSGYVLLEQETNESQPTLVKTVILMQEDDYQSILNGERDGGEGPPVISLQTYNNPLGLTPEEWVEQNPSLSNFPLIMGDMMSTTVAGNPAVSYDADGLYPNRSVVFSNRTFIYYVNGSYLDRDSDIYRDFQPFVDSIKLE